MKKRFLAMLLICMMAFSVTACSVWPISLFTKEEEEEDEDDTEKEEKKSKKKKEKKDKDKKDKEEEPTPQPTPDYSERGEGYVDYELEYHYQYTQDEVDYTLLAKESYETVKILSDDYPELKNAVDALNSEMTEYTESDYAWIQESAVEYADDIKSSGGYYDISARMSIVRSDEDIFSMKRSYSSYAGGAHPYEFFTGYNFDTKTGKKIGVVDLFPNGATAADAIAAILLENYPEDTFFAINPELDEDAPVVQLAKEIYNSYFYVYPDGEQPTYELTFVMCNNGVAVTFNPYDIAAYAFGAITAFLPYDEYADIMDPQYVCPRDNFAERLDAFYNYRGADVDNDGKYDNLYVYMNAVYDEYDPTFTYFDSLTISVNDNEYVDEDTTEAFEYEVYIVKNNGCDYIYLQTHGMNDYSVINVYDLNGGDIVKVGQLDGEVKCFANPQYFEIATHFDILSTYQGTAHYEMGDDGMPVKLDERYSIEYMEDIPLVSVKEMSLDVVDPDTLEVKETKEFPAGTTYNFVSTDGEDDVLFKLDSGDYVMMTSVRDGEGYETVNGESVYDLFETVWYAG